MIMVRTSYFSQLCLIIVLAKDPETYPFFNAYQGTFTEADEALAYIKEDDSTLTEEKSREDEPTTEVVDPIEVKQQIIAEKSNQRLVHSLLCL
jgi:hypothetical protein